MTWTDTLNSGLRALGLDADGGVLAAYVAELDRWNRVYGFVKADREQIVTHHVLDALAAVPLVRRLGPAVADFGSGAGLPAIPLAIALPRLTFTLIERSEKRRAFLSAVVPHVGLQNARVVEHAGGERFDLVTARAVSPLPELAATIAGERLAARLLVWAGTRAAIDAALRTLPYRTSVEPVQVPGLRAERHLVTVELAQAAARR
ncbi:MAG: 16S rRNA (guanine(527)-N(7))-methyltransferase RsmG [Spirochaetaceae bacterium]|nr:16S rRNA (guanine(527)-N(7))-methyltransferase RsmG [Spirochaetaceae bacterium]